MLKLKASFCPSIVLVALLAAAIVAYIQLSTKNAAAAKEKIPFTTILRSHRSGIFYSLDRIIYRDFDWRAFWAEVHANSSSMPPVPEIDFNEKMIIVAAMGGQPSGAHKITITKLLRIRNMLRVVIKETEPGSTPCGGLADGSTSSPIHIIETERRHFVTFKRSILKCD